MKVTPLKVCMTVALCVAQDTWSADPAQLITVEHHWVVECNKALQVCSQQKVLWPLLLWFVHWFFLYM